MQHNWASQPRKTQAEDKELAKTRTQEQTIKQSNALTSFALTAPWSPQPRYKNYKQSAHKPRQGKQKCKDASWRQRAGRRQSSAPQAHNDEKGAENLQTKLSATHSCAFWVRSHRRTCHPSAWHLRINIQEPKQHLSRLACTELSPTIMLSHKLDVTHREAQTNRQDNIQRARQQIKK